MFRNSSLLNRVAAVRGTSDKGENAPVALVADHSGAEIAVLRAVLQRHGFNVLEAQDGGIALDLAARFKPDVVVASFDLPVVNGYQLCETLRQQKNQENLPFILISLPGTVPEKIVGHEIHASDYVQRPLDVREFENRLLAVLRRSDEDTITPGAKEEELQHTRLPRRVELSEDLVDDFVREFRSRNSQGAVEGEGSQKLDQRFLGVEPIASQSRTPRHQRTTGSGLSGEGRLHFGQFPIGTESDAEDLNREYLEQQEIPPEAATLYREAFGFLLNAINQAQRPETLDIERGASVAHRIVESLKRDDSLLLLATDRSAQFSLVQHSVNVAIVGTRLSQVLQLSDARLFRVCLAGILHDIGTVKLPKKFIVRDGGFSSSERSNLENRPLFSAEILKNLPGYEWLPEIVVQVYERENGKGYPKGLRGKDISEEAKILGLADVFEAGIHHRPFRRAMTGYQTLELLTSEVDMFPERITKALLRCLSVYPYNEYVELNTGEIGRVVDINGDNPLRPIVKILFTGEGEKLIKPKVTNLARNSSIWITQAITADALPQKP